jgi:hypothetical protein
MKAHGYYLAAAARAASAEPEISVGHGPLEDGGGGLLVWVDLAVIALIYYSSDAVPRPSVAALGLHTTGAR